MTPLNRPCLDCGQLVRGAGRCARCATATAARRPPKPTRAGYTWAEQQRRAAAVKAHRARFGDWCPGWAARQAHDVLPPNMLTADHVTAVAVSGDQGGPLQVLCRTCNSAKGARP